METSSFRHQRNNLGTKGTINIFIDRKKIKVKILGSNLNISVLCVQHSTNMLSNKFKYFWPNTESPADFLNNFLCHIPHPAMHRSKAKSTPSRRQWHAWNTEILVGPQKLVLQPVGAVTVERWGKLSPNMNGLWHCIWHWPYTSLPVPDLQSQMTLIW